MLNKDGLRELAYLVKIDRVSSMDADRLECAHVGGWCCVVGKDEFKAGDPAVYFEIDSQLPEQPPFNEMEFLKSKKYKIKSQKIRGVISQGLLVPVTAFGWTIGKDSEVIDGASCYKVDDETRFLTERLGVIYAVAEDNSRKAKVNPNAKYQAMSARHVSLAKKKWWRWLMKRDWGKKLLFTFFGKKKDRPLGFPTHFPYIHKTDEERIENMPWALGYPKPLIVTEKLDGTSTTFILERKGRKKFEFYVTSRNVRQLKPDQACFHDSNIYWEMAFKYNVEEKLKHWLELYPEDTYVCIQGESVGNVQGNPLKLEENDFYAFNFITSSRGRLDSITSKKITEEMGIKWVPILEEAYYMPNDMEEFKLVADGKSIINPEVLREGLVLRDPLTNLSFKNVSRQYLLKHKL